MDYLYTLKFDEDPNYERIRFYLQKVIMLTGKAPSKQNLLWSNSNVKKEDASKKKKQYTLEKTALIHLNIDDDVAPDLEEQGLK